MKGIVGLLVLTLICGRCCKQVAEVPGKCMIIQDTRSFKAPAVPAFLTQLNKTQCQDNNNVGGLLRCGQTKVFVKRECVCTFHNVIEATRYHSYSSCPSGEESDMVTQLKCEDCKRYSLNNAGPCTNGGKPTCKGDEVAHEITCECPPNYRGPFCEEKVEKVVRICDKISNVSIEGLKNCDITWNDCVTYSRNKYAYKCNKTKLLLERQGLPLCNDTENTTVNPTTVFKIPTDRDAAKMGQSDAHNSAVGINVSLHLVGLISLTLQRVKLRDKHAILVNEIGG